MAANGTGRDAALQVGFAARTGAWRTMLTVNGPDQAVERRGDRIRIITGSPSAHALFLGHGELSRLVRPAGEDLDLLDS